MSGNISCDNECEIPKDIWSDFCDDSLLQLVEEPLQHNKSGLRTEEIYAGFDNNAGDSWIYPTNLPIRTYQFNITQTALFRNTLVVLPTGLGKTFIAAVVMYNIYRWYPTGKVIFMAPTKPLVAQQINACCKIMDIPLKDTAELTGKIDKKARAELWRTKRVFFATPQVIQSDVADVHQGFPFSNVKLIVVDEAHKAKGHYAYAEVAQSIWNRNRYFRVLALTATPGRRLEDVAEVVRNLFISHIEVRCETSIDVYPFVHKKKIKTVVVPMGKQINTIRSELIEIVDPHIRNLIDKGILSGSLTNINRNWLLYEQKKFREKCLLQRHPDQGAISSDFSICISLYHALELLERHGVRVFLNSFDEGEDNKVKFIVSMNFQLRRLIEKLRQEVGADPFTISDQTMINGAIAQMPSDLYFGHPKFEKARGFLLEHFKENANSRAIVFCEYRESVMLMHRLLLQHRPMLKPRCFVGQGGVTGCLRAVTQKQQIQIMAEFRNGISNILVATSIGEEGIDVGEVDLIICFDISTNNPTRFIQRIGRTGRKKDGSVVMLVTEGKEEALLKDVLANKDKINQKLARSSEISSVLFKHSPRLVPTEFNPMCVKTCVQTFAKEEPKLPTRETKKIKPIKTISSKGTQDVRKFFKKVELAPEERNIFAETSSQSEETKMDHSKYNEKIRLQLKNIDTDSDFAPAKTQLQPSQTIPTDVFDLKRIRKINKYLKSSPSSSLPSLELSEALKSKQYSQSTLRLMLEFSGDYVRRIYKEMKTIWDVHNEDCEDIVALSCKEQQISETYRRIEEVFGGKMELLMFLENEASSEVEDNSVKPPSYHELADKYDHLFVGLDCGGFCRDNYEYITEKFAEIAKKNELVLQQDDSVSKTSVVESMIYETIGDDLLEVIDHTISESKYCSQWDSLADSNQSTPIRPDAAITKRSKDAAGRKSHLQSRPHFNESPIIKAFARQTTDAKMLNDQKESPFSVRSPAKLEKYKRSLQTTINCNQNSSAKKRRLSMISQDDDKYVAHEPPAVLPSIENKNSNNLEAENLFDDDFDDVLAKSLNLCQENDSKHASNLAEVISVDDILAMFSSDAEDVKPDPSPRKNEAKDTLMNSTTPDGIDSCLLTNTEEQKTPSPQVILDIISINEDKNVKANITNPELEDFDLNDFMEPFPQEVIGDVEEKDILLQIDNGNYLNKRSLEITDVGPSSPLLKKLTAIAPEAVIDLISPVKRCQNFQKEAITSPSIFSRNLNSLRSKLFKKQQQESSATLEIDVADESVIVRTKPKKAAKRKIIDSDSDEKDKMLVDKGSDTSGDEIFTQSQGSFRSSSLKRIFEQRKKQRRRCEFILEEADLSGTAVSDDEDEYSVGQHMIDSVVVLDDDAEEDASSVNMHAKYLQSIRSPIAQRGAFKIPMKRVFNDHSRIFSQAVPPDSSLYEKDSFIVSEEESDDNKPEEISLCPLERAEQILKQRKRVKRNAKFRDSSRPTKILALPLNKKKKKRLLKVCNSSDDDFK